MKKNFVITLAVSLVLGLSSTVLAAEAADPLDLKFDGTVTTQFRDDGFTNPTKSTNNGIKTTAIFNIDKPLTSNFDIYARSTFQRYSNTANNFTDTATSSRANGTFDAVGVTYKNAGTFYKIGSQAFTLGATGLVYDNGYIGKHALPYTALVAGKVGAFDYAALYGRTNYQENIPNDKFYGAQFFTNLDPQTKVGGLWVHEHVDSLQSVGISDLSVNVYGVNAAYQFTDEWSFVTEYISAHYNNEAFNKDNTGYVGSFKYVPDKIDSFGVSFWSVGENASAYDHNIGRLTTFWANAKGYSLSWSHQLRKDVTLNIADHIFKKINNAGSVNNDRNSFRAGVTYSF